MTWLLALALGASPDAPPMTPSTAVAGPSAVVGPPAAAPLTGEALEDETHRVSKLVRCPVCQGMSAADSPSESARAMKEEVRQLLAQGYDAEQIISYFEASYGEFIRLEPRAEGFNLLVWVAPAVPLLGGAAVLAWILLQRRAPGPSPEVVPEELLPYLERVRAEVGTAEAPRG